MGTELVDLELNEISGVDHPANLHEGWVVMKNTDDPLHQAAANLIEAADQTVNKEGTGVDLTTDTPADTIDKSIDETPEAADLRKEMSGLRKELADARAEAEAVKSERDLEKAVTRSHDWAIVPGLNPTEFAPVLRSLDADTAEQIEAILDATAKALNEAGSITTEIGTDAAPEAATGWDEINVLAKSIVDEGRAPSMEAAIGMAASENPAAYQRHLTEKGA